MDDGISYLIIFIFLVLSAFFSGSEIAFFSLTKIQLKQIEKKKSKNNSRIFSLLKRPRELLILILLGNTIVNVAASSTAAIIAIQIGETVFHSHSEFIPLFTEIVIMTLLLLIFGEITPKLFAYSSPEKFANFSSAILLVLHYLLWPVIKILSLIGSIFSNKRDSSYQTPLTSEDFQNLIHSKATEKSLEEKEKNIIASIFRFPTTLAKEVMVPRVDMVAMDIKDGLDNLKKIINDTGYSRIPIYKKDIDNIIGFVYAKDIILYPAKKNINSLLRPALFVTENAKIQNLLNQFKKKKLHIAIIVDEYGGTTGLITLEDILEELVGEIMDEYDHEQPMITKISNTEYHINGMYSISDLNEQFSLDLNSTEFDNIADFLYDKFNKVPHKNESFIYQNRVQFTILNVSSQRIHLVKVKIIVRNEENTS